MSKSAKGKGNTFWSIALTVVCLLIAFVLYATITDGKSLFG